MTLLILGLILILLASLFLIPIGLPGTWVMIAAALGYTYLVPQSIGVATLVGICVVAIVAEVLEFTLSGRYTKKYGGSSRAGWGAMLGGLVGAFVGVPVPVVGPVIGGFLGAFAGALIAEFSKGSGVEVSARAAQGAVVGKAVSAAMKVALGMVIAAWVVVAAVV